MSPKKAGSVALKGSLSGGEPGTTPQNLRQDLLSKVKAKNIAIASHMSGSIDHVEKHSPRNPNPPVTKADLNPPTMK